MADSGKGERKEVEKEEEEKEEKSEAQEVLLVDKKRKEQFASFLVSERKEEVLKEEGRERGTLVPRRNNFWEDLEDGCAFSCFRCRIGSVSMLQWGGAKRESGSVGNHYRVGCGGRHFRGLGWQEPSGGAEGKVPERVEAVRRS